MLNALYISPDYSFGLPAPTLTPTIIILSHQHGACVLPTLNGALVAE